MLREGKKQNHIKCQSKPEEVEKEKKKNEEYVHDIKMIIKEHYEQAYLHK